VFIHGFTGHPERTWTHKRGDARHQNEDNNDDELVEPPSKVRRLNPFSRSHHGGNSTSAVYWPQDLVPETIPYARVLTYGYDTHVKHFLGPPVSSNTVYDIAWDFLVALEADRRKEPFRPVLFIAHSLGGIVAKETLRHSSGCHVGQPHLRTVFDSTIGITFFGTPHSGADPRGLLQRIAERAIKAAGFSVNEQIVNTLLPSAERLRELRDEFSPMAHQQNWMIHSFQEQLGVKILSGCKVRIIIYTSSTAYEISAGRRGHIILPKLSIY
jgi:pimeloyl-ACP methyl ester carboxylesterase